VESHRPNCVKFKSHAHYCAQETLVISHHIALETRLTSAGCPYTVRYAYVMNRIFT